MSYANLQSKLEMLPEYLDEVEDYIEFMIFRHKKKEMKQMICQNILESLKSNPTRYRYKGE